MALNHQPNIPDQDLFYEELINAQRELSDDQADLMLAKLVSDSVQSRRRPNGAVRSNCPGA